MPSDADKSTFTVRELGGEIWAEMTIHIDDQDLAVEVKHSLIDLITRVLARHVGERIENDLDLPVEPLPQTLKLQ